MGPRPTRPLQPDARRPTPGPTERTPAQAVLDGLGAAASQRRKRERQSMSGTRTATPRKIPSDMVDPWTRGLPTVVLRRKASSTERPPPAAAVGTGLPRWQNVSRRFVSVSAVDPVRAAGASRKAGTARSLGRNPRVGAPALAATSASGAAAPTPANCQHLLYLRPPSCQARPGETTSYLLGLA